MSLKCLRCGAGAEWIQKTSTKAARSRRAELVKQRTAPRKITKRGAPICAGCGFAHADDYKDCVWLKSY